MLGNVEATVEFIGRDLGDQITDERQILTGYRLRRSRRRAHRRSRGPGFGR